MGYINVQKKDDIIIPIKSNYSEGIPSFFPKYVYTIDKYPNNDDTKVYLYSNSQASEVEPLIYTNIFNDYSSHSGTEFYLQFNNRTDINSTFQNNNIIKMNIRFKTGKSTDYNYYTVNNVSNPAIDIFEFFGFCSLSQIKKDNDPDNIYYQLGTWNEGAGQRDWLQIIQLETWYNMLIIFNYSYKTATFTLTDDNNNPVGSTITVNDTKIGYYDSSYPYIYLGHNRMSNYNGFRSGYIDVNNTWVKDYQDNYLVKIRKDDI